MKIMRRADGERPTDGSNTASSVPSKTGSEAGDSGNERGGGSGKDRLTLTREEREAKYQEVRERIFRDFPDSKSSETPSSEQGANMSRSSSTSGRKKAQRQKTPYDDSFEARSQFNTYYPGIHYAQGPTPYAMNDSAFSGQPPYVVGPGVAPPGMNYSHNGQNNVVYPGQMPMNSMPQYPMPVSPQMSASVPWQGGNLPQQSPFNGYASINQSPAMMNQQPVTKSSPAMNNYAVPYQNTQPNWSSPPFQGGLQQPAYRNQAPVHWPNYPSQPMGSNAASYPYAQYPGQPLNPGMPMQNAHPSAFGRAPFNPQTRSFVPGGGPVSRHPNKGSHQSGMGLYPTMHPGMQPQWNGYPDASRGMEGPNAMRGPPFGTRDSIAKWGTPAHLPPKPPPSEVSYDFAMKSRNAEMHAANAQPNSKNGPLVVSGGVSVPKPN